MTGKEILATVGSLIGGIQLSIDMWVLGADLGDVLFWGILATMLIFTVWYGKAAEKPKKVKRNKVRMIDLKKQQEDYWPMYEL